MFATCFQTVPSSGFEWNLRCEFTVWTLNTLWQIWVFSEGYVDLLGRLSFLWYLQSKFQRWFCLSNQILHLWIILKKNPRCLVTLDRSTYYSPFCVQAKVIKLVGLKNGGRVSPTNLITFACTQNGE
jgi:hypothetical protein